MLQNSPFGSKNTAPREIEFYGQRIKNHLRWRRFNKWPVIGEELAVRAGHGDFVVGSIADEVESA